MHNHGGRSASPQYRERRFHQRTRKEKGSGSFSEEKEPKRLLLLRAMGVEKSRLKKRYSGI
jgi:hypothetical protein